MLFFFKWEEKSIFLLGKSVNINLLSYRSCSHRYCCALGRRQGFRFCARSSHDAIRGLVKYQFFHLVIKFKVIEKYISWRQHPILSKVHSIKLILVWRH